MNDKQKTNVEELLKNPKNGKYLKVVARKFYLAIHYNLQHMTLFCFSYGAVFKA
jgi:hypothetical protein